MSDRPVFDYYYGLESEEYTFIRIPKLLVEDMVFYELSDRAKILYGIMLDRMSLSRKNSWIDKENRVYILFSIDNVAQALNCSKTSACKAIAELDDKHGIGLIEKVKRGQGNPDIIYVKNFTTYVENKPEVGKEKAWDSSVAEKCVSKENDSAEAAESIEDMPESHDFTEDSQNSIFLNSKIQNSKKQNSKKQNSKIQNSAKCTSRISESGPLEFQKMDSNNTDINNTEFNNTEYDNDGLDRLDGYARVTSQIKQNIDYDSLVNNPDEEKRKLYEEIYQLICDVVLVPDEEMKINGKAYPYEMVRQRFMTLKFEHVIYVTECMAENFGKIANIRNYLITALYNAPLTMQNHSDQSFREDNQARVITRYEYQSGERLKALQEAGVVKKYF